MAHYFWGASRDRVGDKAELDAMPVGGFDQAFRFGDEPMIQAAQSRMRDRPLFAMNSALLPMDETAVRARRILARRIAAEQDGVALQSAE